MSVFGRVFPLNPYPDAITFEQPVTLGKSGGTSGRLNFIASDGDTGYFEINISDKLSINNFSGGVSFDNTVTAPKVNSTGSGSVSSASILLPFNVGLYVPIANSMGFSTGSISAGSYNSTGDWIFTGSATFGGKIKAVLSTYANNADALAGGLVANDFYKTATGELRIVV